MGIEFLTRVRKATTLRKKQKPLRVTRKSKSFILFATTIRKSEVASLKRKAMKEFTVVKVIDATAKRRPGKLEPVQNFAILVRKRRKK